MKVSNEWAMKYVEFLAQSFELGWLKFAKTHGEGLNFEEKIIFKLTLLHPEHYFNLSGGKIDKSTFKKKQLDIQGKRLFPKASIKNNCECQKFWGYPCPFPNTVLYADHDFPYSLGGPTHNALNKKYLCRWHNMVKSNDIHVYDWKGLFNDYKYHFENEGLEHWIDQQLKKIIYYFNLDSTQIK